MKAVAISDFNTPPTVLDKPVPEPAEGELLVDVQSASINGMDVMVWAGYLKAVMPYEMPITLGRDFAGTVSAVGRGVTDFTVGDPVFGCLASAMLHHGTFAEQLVITTAHAAKRPDALDVRTAGAVALAGTAAQTAIDRLELKSGNTLLITGATGGVGAIAIQLAKHHGARVIATANLERARFVRELGADDVVDYTADLASALRAIAPGGADAALHAAGDPQTVADLVKPGGRMASVLGFGQQAAGDRDITAMPVMSIPSAQSLGALADLAGSGKLQVPITRTYAFNEVPQGLNDFTSGKHGKLAVVVR